MKAHATHQFRAYATKGGYKRLKEVLELCCDLYNFMWEERKIEYTDYGMKIAYLDQCRELTYIRAASPEWNALSAFIGRGVLRRLDRAYVSYFRRVQGGGKPGHPRPKSKNRYTTIEMAEVYPSMIRRSDDGRHAYIRIKGLPVLKLRTKRELPSPEYLKDLRIVKCPIGWRVDLVYETNKETLESTGQSAGIDMGVYKRLTISNGESVPRRVVDRTHKEDLNRRINRKQKGSNRHRRAVRTLAKYSYRERIKNRNECHRITTNIVHKFDLIGLEDLKIKNLSTSPHGTVENPGTNIAQKSGMNRSVYEQTWGTIRSQLVYKAEWAGRHLIAVNPRFTSQICSGCGEYRAGPWSNYRVFECDCCGLIMDRDVNAAINILKRALETHGQELRPAVAIPQKVDMLTLSQRVALAPEDIRTGMVTHSTTTPNGMRHVSK